MQRVTIAVIGCGSIAESYHLPALSRIENARLKTACDLLPERIELAKSKFAFEEGTTDYRDCLADPDIDAVFILTKIDCHAEIAIASARAGKAIFMQKPLAYSIAEARQILAAVEDNKVLFVPSFMHSYMDGSLAAARLIAEGSIGRIQYVRMRNATKNPVYTTSSYGGCLMDIGCHGMDLIATLCASPIVRVHTNAMLSAVADHHGEETTYGENANLNGSEHTAILHYQLANDAHVTHEVFWSSLSMTSRFEMEIYGDLGAIYLRNPHAEEEVIVGTSPVADPKYHIDWEPLAFSKTFFGETLHRAFVEDVLNQTHKSKTIRNAFVPLQIVEAARRSKSTGQMAELLKV